MTDTSSDATLSNLLHESRRFEPPEALAAAANLTAEAYERAEADRLAYWEEQARRLTWSKPWDTVLDWQPPFAKWFVGGQLNAAYNCVDRHVEAGRGDKVAFYWEGEPGDTRTITYADLLRDVCRAANALVELGVGKGDRVAIYMAMIPETVVTMLACARLGAPHTVVFGGFSADALRSRIQDCDAKLVVTQDGGYRRGAPSPLKPAVDEAVTQCPGVEKVLVVRRTGQDIDWTDGRDHWWHDLVDGQSDQHTAEPHDAEHPLYVMYTSGTTAKPKGILHTTGGYLTQVSFTHWASFDLKADTDVFWTAADVGWVTGHSYIVYGPLSNRATSVMSTVTSPASACPMTRLTTTTCSIDGVSASARSAIGLSRCGWARRKPPSAVTSTLHSASLMRSASESAEKPPNTTEWAAPMRAHASIATGSSGIIGM